MSFRAGESATCLVIVALACIIFLQAKYSLGPRDNLRYWAQGALTRSQLHIPRSFSTPHAIRGLLQGKNCRNLAVRAAIFGDGGAWQRQNPGETPEAVQNPLDALPEPERLSVKAGGFDWSYLQTKGDTSKPTIVLSHGILSSSYVFRDVMKILQRDGYHAVAFDWIGSGKSEKPAKGSFGYSPEDYVSGLKAFLEASGVNGPIVLCTQGYILGQYGILFATKHKDMVDKLVILNTPLGLRSKLPEPLSNYKGLFKGFAFGKNPDAGMYHAAGGPYAFNYTDYQNLQSPFEEGEDTRIALETIMEDLDWNQLLTKVDIAAERFKNPTLVAWGTNDKYLDLSSAVDWLQTKPTSMKLFAFPATMGHFPQLDYPDQMVETIQRFITGGDLNAPSEIAGVGPKGSGPDL
ncbi:hypothetical protein AAMO2058_001363900 [Amorphochlora amoebiformis]